MGLIAWYPLNGDTKNYGSGIEYDLTLDDGSRWVQVLKHDYVKDGVFSSSVPQSDYATKVVRKGSSFTNFSQIQSWNGTDWEFLYYDGGEIRRWSQTVDPNTATYSNTYSKEYPNATESNNTVTPIENLKDYGGLYKNGSQTYYSMHHPSCSGCWYGAIGAFNSYQEGTYPKGFPGVAQSSNYATLFCRVPNKDEDLLPSSGTATYSNEGLLGNAFSGDGTKCLCGEKVLKQSSIMSFAAWVKLNVNDKTMFLDCRTDSPKSMGYQSFYYSGTQFQIYTQGKHASNFNYILEPGKWYHLCSIFTPTVSSLYVNGELVGIDKNYALGDTFELNERMTDITIGGRYTHNMYFLNGLMNDVRIYDHALSVKEVKDLAKCCSLNYSLNDPYIEETTNLLRNDLLQGHGSSWEKLENATFMGHPIYRNTVTREGENNAGFKENSNSFAIPSNAKYITLSFYSRLKKSYGNSMNGYINLNTDNGKKYHWWSYSPSNWYKDESKIGKWTFVTATVKLDPNINYTSKNLFYVYRDNATLGACCDFSQIQLEFKDHPTTFTESSREGLTIFDSSPSLRNGINYNVELSRDSAIGTYSARFNGTNSYIEADFTKKEWFQQNVPMSFNLWIKPEDNANRQIIGMNTYTWILCRNSTGYIKFNQWDHAGGHLNQVSANSTDITPLNKWSMITVVWTGTESKIYINGNLSDTRVAEFGKPNIKRPSEKVHIGGKIYGWGYNSYFKGCISNVKFYETALTDEDVLSLYNSKAQITRNGIFMANSFEEKNENYHHNDILGTSKGKYKEDKANVIVKNPSEVFIKNHTFVVSDFYKIDSTKDLYCEIEYSTNNQNNAIYIGLEMFDKNKISKLSNDGVLYSISPGDNVIPKKYLVDKIPASRFPTVDTDGNLFKTEYARLRVLNNWDNKNADATINITKFNIWQESHEPNTKMVDKKSISNPDMFYEEETPHVRLYKQKIIEANGFNETN